MSPPPASDAERAAPAWPATQQGAESRPGSFGATLFDALDPPSARTANSVFDVCHVGVVLRALLSVHVAVGVGVAFVAATPLQWLMLLAGAAVQALPTVLAWLLVACALKRPLGALPLAGQWLAALALGVAAGAFGAGLASAGGFDVAGASPAPRWVGGMLAGAVGAAVLFQWLRLRAQAALPAETTARLAELQSRIRPHFLFNTLNTALALVRVDPARAEGVLEDLAELFRVALTETSASVTLDDEIELARRYLAIEQIRFGRRLQLQWELDPAAGRARLPPLLLQPLVENAVRHGVEPADAGGTIRVRTQVRRGQALLTIDNTVADAPSNPGHGIALRNVRERLRLMHDVAAQFDTRRDGARFSVRIVLPL